MYGRNETGGDSSHPDENKRQSYSNIGYLKQMTNRNCLLNFDVDDPSTLEIPGIHYLYKYDKKDGWQAFDNDKSDNFLEIYDLLEYLENNLDIPKTIVKQLENSKSYKRFLEDHKNRMEKIRKGAA